MKVQVRVDLAKCVGHGRCYELAPEVFGEDERGHCRVLLESVPPRLVQDTLLAAANCPEDAIRLQKS